MTNSVDLEALEGMLERAERGPWRWLDMPHHDDIDWVGLQADDCARAYAEVGHVLMDGNPELAKKDHANAELIVAAVNALPSLISTLTEQKERLREARVMITILAEAETQSASDLVRQAVAWIEVTRALLSEHNQDAKP